MRRLILPLLCFATASLSLVRAYEFVRVPDNVYAILWASGGISYQIKLPTTTLTPSEGKSYATVAQQAMETWNTQLGQVQFLATVINAPVNPPAGTYENGNGVNEVVMDSTVDGVPFPANTQAVTMYYYFGNTRQEADIVINSAASWDSYTGNLRTNPDLRRIVLHELGHALGLDHPDQANPPQSVVALMNSLPSNVDSLQADDIAGAQALYGAPGVVPANDNFANAITLAGNSAQVTGTNVGATRESGEPFHAGEPDSRSVWWKWTAPANGAVVVSTLGSLFDTELAIYTGTAVNSLTTIASNDDEEPTTPPGLPEGARKRTSLATFTAVANTTYYIAVAGWDGQMAPISLSLAVTETQLAAGERRVWLMNETTPQSSISLGQVSAGWEIAATGDFNGDAKSDIVWQNRNTGQRVIWLMNGTTLMAGAELGFIDIAWRIAGAGDFNGDGKADILWQNQSTGQRRIWLMNGTTFVAFAELGVVDISWQMAGVGDFNGDGKADILWQNLSTGQRSIWLMNGTTFMTGAELGIVDVAWQMAGVGDFNDDGKADILWQNKNTGLRSVWYMNGTSLQSGVNLWTRDVGIDLAGVGDFNGDGKPDILWEEALAIPADFNRDWMGDLVLENSATGERRLWLLDQNLGVTGANLPTLDPNWRLAASLDLNQDGKPDLLLRNQQTGLCRAWYMDGPNFVSGEDLWVVDPNWEIAATADMNHDGQPDLLWQNRASGLRTVWYMNGKTYLNGENLWVVETNWDLVAAADLNHDGQPDLLWQNRASGQRSVWYMSGTTFLSGENLWVVEPDWDLVGVRDLNRDGSVDLLWQHRVSGQRSAWYLNGTTYVSGVNLWVLDPNWRFAF